MELETKIELANHELRLAQKQLDFEREGTGTASSD